MADYNIQQKILNSSGTYDTLNPKTKAELVSYGGTTVANAMVAKGSIVTATLTATSWTGTASPFTYSLSITGVTTTSEQEVLPSSSITAAQLEALQAANIVDGGQSAGKITLKAYGDKPTINIPIRVIKRGETIG